MDREKLAENLLSFMPFVMKRLMKSSPNFKVLKQHFAFLHTIKCDDRKPISHYSEKMVLPKSNLTVLSDRLVKQGLVTREFDPNDRRVVILAITEKGEEFLCRQKKLVVSELTQKLAVFTDEDIGRLNELIKELKEIFGKIDNV